MPGVTTAYQTGIHSARPAASAGCILYACTTHQLVYRSDGSAWTTWADLTGSSATVLTTRGDLLTRDASALKRLALGAAGQRVASDGTDVGWVDETGAVEVVIDGGGSAITTGVKGDIEVPFACTITAARVFADQSGSIVVDIWKDTYANFPPTVADTITASAKPTLSSAAKSQDTTLTGWTTTVAAGDILRFNVDSASTVTRVVLSLTFKKTA